MQDLPRGGPAPCWAARTAPPAVPLWTLLFLLPLCLLQSPPFPPSLQTPLGSQLFQEVFPDWPSWK